MLTIELGDESVVVRTEIIDDQSAIESQNSFEEGSNVRKICMYNQMYSQPM